MLVRGGLSLKWLLYRGAAGWEAVLDSFHSCSHASVLLYVSVPLLWQNRHLRDITCARGVCSCAIDFVLPFSPRRRDHLPDDEAHRKHSRRFQSGPPTKEREMDEYMYSFRACPCSAYSSQGQQ